jgi:hypothetical protein
VTQVSFAAGQAVNCAGGNLQVSIEGAILVLTTNGKQCRARDDSISGSRVVAWCDQAHAFLVGDKGRTLWRYSQTRSSIHPVAELTRLDLHGGYDPGGLYLSEFVELPSKDLLFIYEFGILRVSAAGVVRWHFVHRRLVDHYDGLGSAVIWMRSESGRYALDLDTGHPSMGA